MNGASRTTRYERRMKKTACLRMLQYSYRVLEGKEAVMRIVFLHAKSALGATLSMGLIGLLFAPPLSAQEYPADITRGKAVYQRNCQACHGVGGWGDGPDAKALKVAPANFHRFPSFLKSDEELFRTIEHGVVFSPMHAWRGQLTDGEMQDVVAYIRLLAQQGR
ncbi:MAG: hypothetical protein RL042_1375 [Nitrospirota bacterium]